MSQVKRFVAGVVCPRCAAMDSTRMQRDEEREYRECVKCGFEDSLRLDGRPEHKELGTRVNTDKKALAPDKATKQVEAKPISFYVNPKIQRKDH